MRCRQTVMLGLLLGAFAPPAAPQAPTGGAHSLKDPLDRSLPTLQSPFASVGSAFQLVMLESGTPAGQITLEECDGEPQTVVRLRGGTLRGVLDSIAAADPHYRWEAQSGVVHLLPVGGVPSLLKVRVRSFDSRDATDIVSAGTFLFALPEVSDAAAKLGLTRSGTGSGPYAVAPGPHPQPPRLEVHLRDVTVSDALDAIMRANKRGIWLYREIHCGTVHQFDLNFSQ